MNLMICMIGTSILALNISKIYGYYSFDEFPDDPETLSLLLDLSLSFLVTLILYVPILRVCSSFPAYLYLTFTSTLFPHSSLLVTRYPEKLLRFFRYQNIARSVITLARVLVIVKERYLYINIAEGIVILMNHKGV